jgi:hypothetical protein
LISSFKEGTHYISIFPDFPDSLDGIQLPWRAVSGQFPRLGTSQGCPEFKIIKKLLKN